MLIDYCIQIRFSIRGGVQKWQQERRILVGELIIFFVVMRNLSKMSEFGEMLWAVTIVQFRLYSKFDIQICGRS